MRDGKREKDHSVLHQSRVARRRGWGGFEWEGRRGMAFMINIMMNWLLLSFKIFTLNIGVNKSFIIQISTMLP